ncbi:MAG: YceI family protein [Bacteroidetes bacterium]|nr:YceI family protein [Bacteroidota bacterium]
MRSLIRISFLFLLFTSVILSQGFDVKAKGVQTFSFKDDKGRNQATFHSITPLDEVDGLSTQVSGKVSFNISDVKNTLHGEISLPTESLGTGIRMRDKDLKEPKWLDAEKYPTISFKIKKILDVQKLEPNKLKVKVLGGFNLHGVTNDITAEVTMTYLDESQATEAREPGDLLGVTGNFSITLSKYNVQNMVLGTRVSDNIDIGVNIVGTNKF